MYQHEAKCQEYLVSDILRIESNRRNLLSFIEHVENKKDSWRHKMHQSQSKRDLHFTPNMCSLGFVFFNPVELICWAVESG